MSKFDFLRPWRKRPPIINVWQGKDDKWYFHVRASNGKIQSPSQGYSTKSNAIRAARKLFPDFVIEYPE